MVKGFILRTYPIPHVEKTTFVATKTPHPLAEKEICTKGDYLNRSYVNQNLRIPQYRFHQTQ